MTDELPNDLIDVKEAARLAHNTHHATIRRWVLTGKMRGYKLGGRRYLVSRADVLAMIARVVPVKPVGLGPNVVSGAVASASHKAAVEFLRSRGIT